MSNSTRTPGDNHQAWDQVAGNAREAVECVSEMASHAATAVGSMAGQTAGAVGKKVDDLAASAGAGIQGLGDKISKNTPRAGAVGNASQAVAKTVKDSGRYIETAKLSGITEDVAEWIRRNPVPTVLLGIGLGWLVWRTLRR